MTVAPRETYITVEEYEASEAKSPVKREYFQRRVEPDLDLFNEPQTSFATPTPLILSTASEEMPNS